MSPSLLLAPTVKVNSRALADRWRDALVDLRVELEYRTPGRATLRFADPGYALAGSEHIKLGASIEIAVRDAGTLLTGDVTGLGVDQDANDSPVFTVVAHDRAYRLARGTRVATYASSSYLTVVSQLARSAGLTPRVVGGGGTIDYLLQVDSDLALLDALADRGGFDWQVEGTTLKFSKGQVPERVTLTMGEELLSFGARASGLRPDAVRIEGWDRTAQESVSYTADSPSDSVRPDVAIFSAFADPKTKLGGKAEYVAASLAAGEKNEAQALGQALLDRVTAAAYTATGTAWVTPTLKPGKAVVVSRCGPVSGTYHVTKVEHRYRRDGFRTYFEAGDRTPTSLVDTLGRYPAAPFPGSFSYTGLVVGQVTNINDPDSMGRAKVRFPGLSSQQESDWARVLGLGGGAERGQVFLPEVGDEVLVGFEGGDPRQPVVLGGLYGKKSTIPSPGIKEGKVSGRRITSRLGHVLEMGDGDTPSDQYILLALAGKEQAINFAKDKVEVTVPAGVPLTLKVGNSSLKFDDAGNLAIQAVNVSIKAESQLSMEGQAGVSVKGATVDLQGEAEASVKADGEVSVQSSGITTIKGSMVMIN